MSELKIDLFMAMCKEVQLVYEAYYFDNKLTLFDFPVNDTDYIHNETVLRFTDDPKCDNSFLQSKFETPEDLIAVMPMTHDNGKSSIWTA